MKFQQCLWLVMAITIDRQANETAHQRYTLQKSAEKF